MKIFLLISISCLITPLVICAELEGLVGKSLLFPANTQADHVVLEPKKTSLTDLTLCLRFNSELRTKHTLFSYNMPASKGLQLIREDERTIIVSITGKDLRFQLPANLWGWVHICATHDSRQQLVGFYIEGEPGARKAIEVAVPLTFKNSAILGHEEANIGQEQNFVGEMLDVNLWDRVLAPKTIRALCKGAAAPQGNVIGWLTARLQTKGRIIAAESSRRQ